MGNDKDYHGMRDQDLEEGLEQADFFSSSRLAPTGFASNTLEQDVATIYTPTENETFMIAAGDTGLLDKSPGYLDVSKVPGYSIDDALQADGELAGKLKTGRRFVYADQFIKIDITSTLAGIDAKKGSPIYQKLEAALLRECSLENVENFMIFTDWADQYDVKEGPEHRIAQITTPHYQFQLADPQRLAEVYAERRSIESGDYDETVETARDTIQAAFAAGSDGDADAELDDDAGEDEDYT